MPDFDTLIYEKPEAGMSVSFCGCGNGTTNISRGLLKDCRWLPEAPLDLSPGSANASPAFRRGASIRSINGVSGVAGRPESGRGGMRSWM